MRKSAVRRIGLATLLFAGAGSAAGASAGPTASQAVLSFSYQVNSTTFPAAAKLTVTLPATASTLPLTVTVASAPQGWLAVTPDGGKSPLALTATVNPTSLAPGSYSGAITIDTVPGSGSPAVVAVTLSVSNPPATLMVTSPSANYAPAASGSSSPLLTFGYSTGAAAPTPASAELDVASTSDLIPFNVTAGGASSKSKGSASAAWLRVGETGQLPGLQTSGAALSGSQVPILVTLDQATLATLDPGSYTGTIAIAADNPANGAVTVTVNLVVSAGPPVLRASFPVFPASLPAGPTIDPVLTIYGDNFFNTTVVTLQQGASPPLTLPSQLISRKVLQATIKAAYLAAPAGAAVYPIVWTLSVFNPAPPANPAQPPAQTTFTVTDPTQPAISSVVNAASYLPTAVQTGTAANPVPAGAVSASPREIVSIFGRNLGPAIAATTTAAGTPPVFPVAAGGVQVMFSLASSKTVYAPLLMTSANQINCVVPLEVAAMLGTANPSVTVQVLNGAASTTAFPVTVVTADPGVFSFGGFGQGQAAVLNFDDASGSYTVNSSKNAAPRGSTISIYATGLGDLAGSATLPNGAIAPGAATLADNTARVDIDGQPAVVTYAGTSPGAVAGLVQINAVVPPTVRTGAAIPITVSVGSAATARRSQAGLTLAVK
ncbi:MAG TPA: hypothetical protein VFA33_18430 [Bryobacteraceae bacterium]|nr:hypothetical protein [Bryobacteraceae bacterium]